MNKKSKILCFYHSADFDGHCSGAIIKKKFPNADMQGINYGQDFPWRLVEDEYDKVYMVDFSLQPIDDMFRLARTVSLTWIDHHDSAINAYRADVRSFRDGRYKPGTHAILDNKYAACELTWMAMSTEPIPTGVRLLGRYDVWDLDWAEGVLPFQYGMRLIEQTHPTEAMPLWNTIFNDDGIDRRPQGEDSFVRKTTERGRDVLKYADNQSRIYSKAGMFEAKFEGLPALCLNRGLMNSRMFDAAYDPNRHKLMFAFCWYRDHWKIGLYSTHEHVHVGTLAKKYGGGGHAGAAGFNTMTSPFDMLDLAKY